MTKFPIHPLALVSLVLLFPLETSSDAPAQVSGRWEISIQFVHGNGKYTAFFEQDGERLTGTYRGQFVEGELTGTVRGASIQFRGTLKIEGTRLFYDYTGIIEGDQMKGTVRMDEYGEGQWTAHKHRQSTVHAQKNRSSDSLWTSPYEQTVEMGPFLPFCLDLVLHS